VLGTLNHTPNTTTTTIIIINSSSRVSEVRLAYFTMNDGAFCKSNSKNLVNGNQQTLKAAKILSFELFSKKCSLMWHGCLLVMRSTLRDRRVRKRARQTCNLQWKD